MKAFFPTASFVGGEHLPEELTFVFRFRFRQLLEVLCEIRGKGHCVDYSKPGTGSSLIKPV
jgi:hypothetical protein